VLGDANTAAATGYQLQVQVIFSPYDRLYLYVQFNTAVSLEEVDNKFVAGYTYPVVCNRLQNYRNYLVCNSSTLFSYFICTPIR
jgi:hypothetical protein